MVSKAQLYLVHANWCPYCVSFKNDPEPGSKLSSWDVIKGKSKGVGFNAVALADSDADFAAKTSKFANLVNGYPSIILEHDGKYYKYENQRESGPIIDFVKQHIASNGGQSKKASKAAKASKAVAKPKAKVPKKRATKA